MVQRSSADPGGSAVRAEAARSNAERRPAGQQAGDGNRTRTSSRATPRSCSLKLWQFRPADIGTCVRSMEQDSDAIGPQQLRRCGTCGAFKAPEDFAWRRRARGQRDSMCRPCRAEYKQAHYAANRARYLANAMARRRALIVERTTYLVGYFAQHPCVDCGESDPVVLEFDHLRDKAFDIGGKLADRAWSDILAEIEKCEVVCANCHRRRTATRRGALRATLTAVSDVQAGDRN